jgi:hypothetical protein
MGGDQTEDDDDKDDNDPIRNDPSPTSVVGSSLHFSSVKSAPRRRRVAPPL